MTNLALASTKASGALASRTLGDRHADVGCSVKDFWLSSDADWVNAFTRAAAAAASGSGVVIVPPGTYNCQSARIDPGAGPITYMGVPGQSILQGYEGTNATPQGLFYYQGSVRRQSVTFIGLTFLGTYTVADTASRGGPMVFLDRYDSVTFRNCAWKLCSMMATDTHFNNRVVWENCTFEDIARDGARARDCFNVEVTDCVFRRMGDDAVAYHTAQYTTGYNPNDGTPRREGLIVKGCHFLDVHTSISALGCRSAVIANNVAMRQQGTFAYLVNSTGEGNHPMYSLKIADNVIQDGFNGDIQPAIYVSCQTPRATAASNNIIPNFPDPATGLFTTAMPWNFNNVTLVDATNPFPPARHMSITGNVIARTLPTVTNYTDFGFGYAGSSVGPANNPAITESKRRWVQGIEVAGGMNILVAGNTISHCGTGITIRVPQVNPGTMGVRVANNVMTDCITQGIAVGSSARLMTDIVIDGNHINGDPYRLHANSLPTGKYTSGFTYPRAIDLGNAQGVVVKNNHIKNVAQAIQAVTNVDDNLFEDNTLVCNPVNVGSDANNVGIGNIPRPSDGYRFVIEDCNPQSATWGQLINVCVRKATSIPTAGTYVLGAFVEDAIPVISTGKVRMGWKRLTTGNAHVLNTDWAPVYCTNS